MGRKSSIADELVAGFTELADALEGGDDLGAQFNCYQMQIDLRPVTYTPALVRATRERLGASQAVLGKFLGVTAKSVSQWERGVTAPNPIACRFMDEIRRNPAYYVARLQESMVRKAGRRGKRVGGG
jgi:DNA-binding transcriptional regulator YiaG